MLTEQKLLFSWWPDEKCKPLINSKSDNPQYLTAAYYSTDLACGCLAPSCRAGQCSCPGWCDRHDWACCCLIPLSWKLAAWAAPAAVASTLLKKRQVMCDNDPQWAQLKWAEFKNEISPFRVREVNVGAKFNDLSHCFLLWAVWGEKSEVWDAYCLKSKTVIEWVSEWVCADLGVLVSWTGWALLKAGGELAVMFIEVRLPLLLANARAVFVVAGESEVCSPSSSFSLSFSSYNTSTWA